MKIFNAMFSKVNGGLEQTFLNYIPALNSQGNNVIPIIHPQAQIRNDCPQQHLHTIHNFNQHDWYAVYKLRRLIQKEQPDCVITHSYRAAYLFKKTFTKIPKIAVCHVQGHYKFGADALIAITETMREEIIASGVLPAHKVFTVPNMIPITPQHIYQEPQEHLSPIIGVCARHVSMKGVDVFLAALAELKKRQVVFKAYVAGDGPEQTIYQQLAKQYNIQQEVSFLGWVHDRETFYRSLDIFCLPSRKEAFGLVILESMLHSLPLVLSDLPGPREIIAQSQSALFTPVEDSISMANNLERLITNKELRTQLGANAFARVQHYSIERIGAQLHQILEQICSSN